MRVDLPEPADELDFTCNVCGAQNRIATKLFHRELAGCVSCSSNARFRGVIGVLGRRLLKRRDPMPQWPKRPDLRGIGMSDAESYASRLAATFSYTNTFYHQPPRLDICADTLPYSDLDFVISSDVLEHVAPPVSRAIAGLRRVLRPGGLLVLTVPYVPGPTTLEHFPELHTWRVFDFEGRHVLVNRNEAGRLSVRDDLVFHGGPGSTLELRVFGRGALFAELKRSGFGEIIEHSKPFVDVGYYWPEQKGPAGSRPFLGYVISAKAM